jgi:hypothetical protein
VLFLHASYRLCRASHRIQVVGENPSGIFIARFPKDGIEPSLHALRVSVDSPGPDANQDYRCQEHEPEDKRVLIVGCVKRIDDKLTDGKSIIDIV